MPNRIRLLLVDDDVVDRQIVIRALQDAAVELLVTEASSADEALSLLAAHHGTFDCAVFDLHLPGRDGAELLGEVRGAGIDLPIIFLTGQGNEEAAVGLMKAGASDYLTKRGLVPGRLAQSIRQAMRLGRAQRAQREAERALRESEAQFRRLSENMPDAVARFDLAGRYLFANRVPPWHHTSSDAGGLLGRTTRDIGADEVVASALELRLAAAAMGERAQVTLVVPPPVVEAAAEGDGEVEGEVEGELAGTPEPRWIEVRFVPERAGAEGEGPVATVLAIIRDVTAERMRQEEEERRIEFEHQLMGIVSHDLRNPIGAILMSVGLLKRKLADSNDPRLTHTLDILESSSQRAQRMIADILDFTRARLGGGIPLSLGPTDLGEVAVQLVAELRSSYAGRAIELTVSRDTSGQFDPDRVAQAISNLVGNAINYGDVDAPVSVTVTGIDNEVHVDVTNRGPTIAPEILPALFKPFQRGPAPKGASRSVGLGLFIVERIVVGHRGRIEAVSRDGVTTFRMVLPRRPPSGRMRAVTLTAVAAVAPPGSSTPSSGA